MQSVVEEVAKMLSPVYLVGGSVRDALLGVRPKDYDFATPLLPDEIERRVRETGRRVFVSGKRFGTIGFKVAGTPVEVTTFRSETYAPGSRKPSVEFVDDISHDLSRRDFTINAMAQRMDGSLVDPYGGRSDTCARVIRCVGKPYARFNDDPLRMLRAARFVSQLGFRITGPTEAQMLRKAHRILDVSRERWMQELDRLLVGKFVADGLDVLGRTRIINFMVPELAIQVGYDQDRPYHGLDLWRHTIKTVSLTPPDPALRWAALLHDVGKPFARHKDEKGYSNYTYHETLGAEMTVKIGSYLRWPSKRIELVSGLVGNHLESGSPLRAADSIAKKA